MLQALCKLFSLTTTIQLCLVCALPVPLGRAPSSPVGCKGRRPVFQSTPKHDNFMAVDLWLDRCLTDLESLRSHPLFPLKPTHKAVVHNLALSPKGTQYCHRITGTLAPPAPGPYMFHVKASGEVEVWISSDESPTNSRRIVQVAHDRQSSQRIMLEKDRQYFFEVMNCAVEDDELQVLWLIPGHKDYTHISSIHLYPPRSTSATSPSVTLEPPALPHPPTTTQPPLHVLEPPGEDIPKCGDVVPSANSVSDIEAVSVYPIDYTDIRNRKSIVLGNQILSPEMVRILEPKLLATYPTLDTISDIKLYPDGLLWFTGSTPTNQRVGGWLGYHDNMICSLDNWQPANKDKTITMVVSVKGDFTKEVESLLQNLQQIQQSSPDYTVNLLIVDFNGGDENRHLVQRLGAERVNIVTVDGDFDRGLAMSVGANNAAPGSLLFFIDLQLQIPRDIAETLWTHTIPGRTSFAPVLVRLNPHSTPNSPNGYWEMAGFGLLSVFREDYFSSDCDKRTPTFRWGGEDHYIVNRLLKNNINVIRRRLPGLFHFHHDRTWSNGVERR